MRIKKATAPNTYNQLFEDLKRGITLFDPVSFAENYLTLDTGDKFDLSGNGWKYMADMWRYVGLQADNRKAKPIVELKGRQVGATTKAGAMGLYFTASGLFGTEVGKPPIRVMHLFPSLKHVGQYTKEKLGPMIRNSVDGFIARRSLQYDPDSFGKIPDDTLSEKFFIGENILRVDSIGRDADRIRGTTQDVLLFDECFPYTQCVEVEGGKIKIGALYDMFKKGKPLPKALSYNESTSLFEYKQIENVWNRGRKKLIEVRCSKRKIKCTEKHRFLTKRGWVAAINLKEGDLLKVSPGTKQYIRPLNSAQYQIALGSFLGDGHLSSHTKGRYRLHVIHGIKQSNYCKWKASMFEAKPQRIEKNGYAQTPAIRFSSKTFSLPKLPQSKSTCPQWVLDDLDERGLAIWFMDDGDINIGKNGAKISTCSFDEDSQKRIVAKLKAFGVEATYKKYSGHFYIMLKKNGYLALSKIIEPYVHPDLAYKVNDLTATNKHCWDKTSASHGFYRVDQIKDIDEEKEVFDIEVKDNHNFIVTSRKDAKGLGGPIVHNCQDMTRRAIENATKIARHAKYGAKADGLQLYFGTPKNSGTYFWTLWNDSDQRFYQLRCTSCLEHFFLYSLEDDNLWNEIWVKEQEVRCPHCAHHQDKKDAIDGGRWVPTRVTRDGDRVIDFHQKKSNVGYHHNLMLMPIFDKEDILKSWPKHNPNASERAWKNETLGDFYRGGGMPLTMDDIILNALDETRGTSKLIKDRTGKTLVLGMDWGGMDDDEEEEGITKGQSYTTAVILSIDTSGIFTIENAFKLKKNDIMYHVDVIDKLFKTYRIHQAVADQMWGQQTVRYMQLDMSYRNRFLGCINSGNINKLFSYDPKYMRVTVNKDQMIDEIFEMIRRGRIRFPAKGLAWEQLHWLAEHCTSMETITRMKNDNVVKKYIKGSKPNDGLMALMYGVVAYKYLATGAFKTLKEAHGAGHLPKPIIGYSRF